MPWPVVSIVVAQCLMLTLFVAFAFFNYLYAVASLRRTTVALSAVPPAKVAVVIVSFNERNVLPATIAACEQLTHADATIVLADDSTDAVASESVRAMAIDRGCIRDHALEAAMHQPGDAVSVQVWESSSFLLMQRSENVGFKAGSLREVCKLLEARGFSHMYLLDADWRPPPDALERTLAAIASSPDIAFVQTKRLTLPVGLNLFQKYVALIEEGCYQVDFEGRQALGHPILFSGCCALFDLAALKSVGGFTPGHLTEDLDLSNRFWLSGWKGVYLGSVVNYGEVPFSYDHYRRQQERWAAGSARACREYFGRLLCNRAMPWAGRLSALRQNAYFLLTLLTGVAIAAGMATVAWLVLGWNSYPVESYLHALDRVSTPLQLLVLFCLASNFAQPVVMVLAKRRQPRDLLHVPMMVWYGWSVIPTYVAGNIKGLLGLRLDWFRTPKYVRSEVQALASSPRSSRAVSLVICAAMVGFYFLQGSVFGWLDPFALVLIPAFVLAVIR